MELEEKTVSASENKDKYYFLKGVVLVRGIKDVHRSLDKRLPGKGQIV